MACAARQVLLFGEIALQFAADCLASLLAGKLQVTCSPEHQAEMLRHCEKGANSPYLISFGLFLPAGAHRRGTGFASRGDMAGLEDRSRNGRRRRAVGEGHRAAALSTARGTSEGPWIGRHCGCSIVL